MKKQKREYPEVFKERAISLLCSSGRSAADIERELGITTGLLSRWNRLKAKAEGEIIASRANRPLAEEPIAERVKQLERKNERLRQEKEIFKTYNEVRLNNRELLSIWCRPLILKWEHCIPVL